MRAIEKCIIGYTRYISTLPVESNLPEQALAELAALREAGEKMAALLGEDITDDQLTEALDAWKAANK